MRTRVLVIDTENQLPSLLVEQKFEVEWVVDGDSGFARASTGEFDLIILDAVLRGRSGMTVCQDLRRVGIETALLMVTQETPAAERVAALKSGADDCVTRLCDPNELLARVEALLRRSPKPCGTAIRMLRFGQIEIDFRSGAARERGTMINLGAKELHLLEYLVNHRERVISREELLRNVWGYDAHVCSRTIDVHIGWLRHKLEDDPQHPNHIKTIRGVGYRFDL